MSYLACRVATHRPLMALSGGGCLPDPPEAHTIFGRAAPLGAGRPPPLAPSLLRMICRGKTSSTSSNDNVQVKFIWWVVGVILTLGLADSFAQLTYKMATAAARAHMHDQISYAAYSKMLWANPKTPSKAKPCLYPGTKRDKTEGCRRRPER